MNWYIKTENIKLGRIEGGIANSATVVGDSVSYFREL